MDDRVILEMVLPPMFGKEKLMTFALYRIAPAYKRCYFFCASILSLGSPQYPDWNLTTFWELIHE